MMLGDWFRFWSTSKERNEIIAAQRAGIAAIRGDVEAMNGKMACLQRKLHEAESERDRLRELYAAQQKRADDLRVIRDELTALVDQYHHRLIRIRQILKEDFDVGPGLTRLKEQAAAGG